MGVPVSTFDEFQKKISSVKGDSVIFGFLLYDSRPSQEIVNRFAQEQAPWIDELARGAGIYFFFPFRRSEGEFKNPSIEIAKIFKLGVARLPGVLLFAPPGRDGKMENKHAVYIPLKNTDFNSIDSYEPIFIDLFQLIGDSITKNKKSHEVLVHIQEELKELRKRKNQRGIAAYIRKGAHLVLIEIPKTVIDNFSEGFGKALGEKAAGP